MLFLTLMDNFCTKNTGPDHGSGGPEDKTGKGAPLQWEASPARARSALDPAGGENFDILDASMA